MDESAAARTGELEPSGLAEQFGALEEAVTDRLRNGGFDPSDAGLSRSADIRYRGQSYELQIRVDPPPLDEASMHAIRERFDDRHRRLYGHSMPEEPIEVVTLRVAGSIELPDLDEALETKGETTRGQRKIRFTEGEVFRTPVLNRATMDVGTMHEGPVVIEDAGSTTLIPPHKTATVRPNGAIVIA
jgi:N-methylhydantoinase A